MTKKRILLGLLAVLCIYVAYLLYIFVLSPKSNLQPIYLIPNDAVFIIESDKPVEGWRKISESETWSHLKKNRYFSELTESIQRMDTVFNNQRRLFEQFDGRSLLISIHMISPKDYGVFYVLDLKQIAKLKLLRSYLNSLLNENYSLSKRTYHGHEILEVFDRRNKQTVHLAFIKNQLVASYTHTLVEASIDQHLEPVIGRDLDFIQINEKVGHENLFRLYVQYAYFDDYVKLYSDYPQDWVKRVSENFRYTGFHIDLDEDVITADGFTHIGLNNETYLQALQRSGTAKRTVPQISPKGTALYLSYGFESFEEFYRNFETITQENPEQFTTYNEGIQSVEKFLKISVKDNFLSWIGNELAVLQLKPLIDGQKNDLALVLKTKDIEAAKTNLDFILKQLKKRTPVKFKAVEFKGHQINFLSIKGFFKMLLGARFEEFDKPYFTIIREFVVFSDNPNTLKSIISDFEASQTLASTKEFQDFERHFDDASSLFVYGNVPLVFDNVYDMMDAQTKIRMRKNKDYFICFPQLGFQLTPRDNLFESKLVTMYKNTEDVKGNPYFYQKPTKPKSQPVSKIQKEITEAVFNLRPIYPSDLNAKTFVGTYSSGKIRFEVDLKDGKKHGGYKEFYIDGAKKMTGRFRNDEQVGTWRYFDRNGELIIKKRF